MKKLVSICLALCLTTALGTTAFAHGHHRGGCGVRVYQSNGVCPYEDCLETGYHTHDGSAYCGHYYGDGHDYHDSNYGYGSGCYGGGCHHYY